MFLSRYADDHGERHLTPAAHAAIALAFALASARAEGAQELTLAQAVRIALQSNPQVVESSLAHEASGIGLETSRSDFDFRIVPTTTLARIGSNAFTSSTGVNSSVGLQVARRFETGTVVSIGPSFNRTGADRNTTLTASLEQPLITGWQRDITLDGVRRAEFQLAASHRALDQVREQVALETIGAYYAVMREQSVVAFSAAQRERIERHARIAETKERSGIIGPMDRYRATIRLKDAEDALNQARVAELAALNRLRRALDLPVDVALTLHPPGEVRLPEIGRVESDALDLRPELLELRAQYEEAVRQARVAEKRIQPELTLLVTAGQATQPDPLLVQFLPATQRQWSVSLQASSDLRRTAERNAWRQARLRVDSVRAALDARVENVRRQVRDHILLLADMRTRIALREDQIRQAEARLALAQVKFAHDMANNLDVIEAEGELQRAESSAAATRADYALGVYQLHALGGQLLALFQ